MSGKQTLPDLPAEAVEQYPVLESQVMQIPEVTDEDDVMERILAQLDAAARPEDLNDPWDAAGFEGLNTHTLRITEVGRRPSDFQESRVGHFLVVRGMDLSTGRDFVATTGSEATMKQLAMAYINKWLPADFEVVVVKTKAGNTAIHLKYLGKPDTKREDGPF